MTGKVSFRQIILLSILMISFLCLFCGCQKNIDVTLYFAKYEDNQAFLAPETRSIDVSENLLKDIVVELIAGPRSVELYPTLPSDIKVLSVTVEGDTAVVDLSKEAITNFDEIPHSSTTEPLAIYSIVNTLTEFEDIESVRIRIEGRSSGEIDGLYIEDFWGHLGISDLFYRNEDIIG